MIEDIEDWLKPDGRQRLSRDVDGQFYIGTDVGLKRTENQDRAAVLRVSSKAQSFTCVCVCDGMGGMVDGSRAATLALATFFTSLVTNRRLAPYERLDKSAREASDAVASRVKGGGATLSALLIDGTQATTINVGDSRIYRFHQGSLRRLTVDDTMAEAYGGEGTGLLQFIGMKSGLKPHINRIEINQDVLVITSDGAHRIGEPLLADLISNSPHRQLFTDRVLNVANWVGGVDNATIVTTAPLSELTRPQSPASSEVAIWSPSGKLKIAWTPSTMPSGGANISPKVPDEAPPEQSMPKAAFSNEGEKKAAGADKQQQNKQKAPRRKRGEKREQIEIGFSEDEHK